MKIIKRSLISFLALALVFSLGFIVPPIKESKAVQPQGLENFLDVSVENGPFCKGEDAYVRIKVKNTSKNCQTTGIDFSLDKWPEECYPGHVMSPQTNKLNATPKTCNWKVKKTASQGKFLYDYGHVGKEGIYTGALGHWYYLFSEAAEDLPGVKCVGGAPGSNSDCIPGSGPWPSESVGFGNWPDIGPPQAGGWRADYVGWTLSEPDAVLAVGAEETFEFPYHFNEDAEDSYYGHFFYGVDENDNPYGLEGWILGSSFKVELKDCKVSPTEETTLTLEGGKVEIKVPSGASDADMKIAAKKNPVPSSKPENVIGDVYTITAKDLEGNEITEDFGEKATLTLKYSANDLKGYLEDSLKIHEYDESLKKWVALDSTVDKTNKTVSCKTDHFTDFAILGTLPPMAQGSGFFAYSEAFKGGVNVASGDVTGDGVAEIIVGAGKGGGPHIRIFSKSGKLLGEFFAYHPDFRGGVNVACGDINGDGKDEIIAGAGNGGGPHIRVFNKNEDLLLQFFAYDENFRGGVNVAAGDINGDGIDEIIAGAGFGGGPHVRVFDQKGKYVGWDMFPFHPDFRGGVKVAAGDTDGDGKDEIGVCQASQGEAWCKVYKYNTAHTILGEWLAYPRGVECGASITMFDIDSDTKAEVITGAGIGGGPQIRVFSGSGKYKGIGFFAYHPLFRGGVQVASSDIDNDGRAEIIVGAGFGGGPQVRIFEP